ncbi:MAG: hypothetical protein AB7S38_08530 [Vulcanimicrobiota bacterium]
MADLEDFLDQARTAGRTESEGVFTVELTRALERLGQFQLAQPGLYLAKVLQVAHCLQASSIRFRLTPWRAEAVFRPESDQRLPILELAEALAGRRDWNSPAARHLGAALRAASGPGLRWELGDSFLKLRPGPIEWTQGQTSGQARFLHRRGGLLAMLGGLRSYASEHATIYERGRYSTIPIGLDGRNIEKGWPTSRPGGNWFDYMSGPYYLMEGFAPPSAPLPGWSYPFSLKPFTRESAHLYRRSCFREDRTGWADISFWPRRTLPWQSLFLHLPFDPPLGDTIRCGAAFALPLSLTGKASVCFMLDGVPSSPCSLELGCPGLLCLVSGEGLTTDLSEFQVVQNDAFQARVEALRTALKPFLEALLACRPRFAKLWQPGEAGLGDRYQTEVREGIHQRLAAVKV